MSKKSKTSSEARHEEVSPKALKEKSKKEKKSDAEASDVKVLESRIKRLEEVCQSLREEFAEVQLRDALKHWDNKLLQTCATKYKVDVSEFNAKKRTNMPQLIAALICADSVPLFWKETLKEIFRDREQYRESRSRRANYAGDGIVAMAKRDDDFVSIFSSESKREQVRKIRQCCQDICEEQQQADQSTDEE